MKNTKRKGFTIVELVIVIAVIAILAAVLIPTFASLVKKANESADIQAAKNMNTFLAAANITGDIDSILDVYDLFEDSGYSVESYKPLYADRIYYYDKQENKILYVEDDGSGKIIYPADSNADWAKTHDWFSLNMTLEKTEALTGDNYKEESDVRVAKVSTPAQYAWVVEQFNNNQVDKLKIVLTKDLDFRGARCVINKVNASQSVTICSDTEGTQRTIKNITNNIHLETDTAHNSEGTQADYYSGGIIAKSENGTINISDVVFENINVKTSTAGQVGIVIGCMDRGDTTFKNVTLKNCSVIGHRDVGSLVGALQSGAASLTLTGDVKLENVKVKTTGGRSGLLVGKIVEKAGAKLIISTDANIAINNSAMSIYEDASLEQKIVNESTIPSEWNSAVSKVQIADQDKCIYSYKGDADNGSKEYSAYGYKSDALVLVENNGWSAITSVDSFKTKWSSN